MRHFDYVILGSGIAGLYTALLAREHGPVLILTKGSIEDCNTRFAQGGIAAAVGPGDSAELHIQDTLRAGAGLCDSIMVEIMCQEAPSRIADLIRFGVPFDTVHGEVALTKEGAHSLPRVLHAGGDATGMHIELSLSSLAKQSNITIQEYALGTEVLKADGRAVGVRALDLRSGRFEEFEGAHIVLATGGAGRLYRSTTNPEVATADGVALAYLAGAEMKDMEFVQFHPTALCMPNVPTFLISEAMRGEGAVLRNIHGEAFMARYSLLGDLAPRDIVARAIVEEMRKTGADHVLLDATPLKGQGIPARFPQIYQFCLQHGLDITTMPIPVAPAAHYMMGGVRINAWGETSVAGLLACGEVAVTGVHGANRLASNSLLEVVVFAHRLVQKSAGLAGQSAAHPFSDGAIPLPVRRPPQETSSRPTREALQRLMWDRVGILRDGRGLLEAARSLAAWEQELQSPSSPQKFELRNMVLAGRLIAEAALLREESRGAHYRTDFPEPQPEWQRSIIFKRADQ
jgi:L-aspartate oxidase